MQPRLESVPPLHATQPLRSPLDGLFANRRSLARAVVAAEVLGRPLALRDGD
ncbi:MAG: hypothetical protein JOY69_05695 [Candidatus Eremiobacteraeota bacterium]|nr:hypothetical protein [Candidatus Eremiobacteraeota bacterium]